MNVGKIGSKLPYVYPAHLEKKAYLYSPLLGIMKSQKKKFAINIPKALKVGLVILPGQIFHSIENYNNDNYFGLFEIPDYATEIHIVANFEGNPNFVSLIKFTVR